MTPTRLAACAALLVLAACNRNPPELDVPAAADAGSEAPVADAVPPANGAPANPGTAASPPVRAPGDLEQVAVSGDAVAVGSALGADGRASAPKPEYTLDDTIHATVNAGAVKPGATAHVYWTYQDGMTIKEEDKRANGAVLAFTLSAADGMQPGRYSVQVDLDGVPVGITDFVVR